MTEIGNCLDVIQEECAEIIQVVSKIKRFGFDSYHPKDASLTNTDLLGQEFGDLMGAIYKLVDLTFGEDHTAVDRFNDFVVKHSDAKSERIDKYFEVTKEHGVV